jgi:hypothetical protein
MNTTRRLDGVVELDSDPVQEVIVVNTKDTVTFCIGRWLEIKVDRKDLLVAVGVSDEDLRQLKGHRE